MSMNPFCEIAVEQAVQMREAKKASQVVAVSIGPKKCEETLRTALAMGCDRAIHIDTDVETDLQLQPLSVAKIFQEIVKREEPGMVILGKQGIDGDFNQTAAMLAGLLKWPQAMFASEIDLESADSKECKVTREIDGGLQTLSVPLPAVVSCDLRLNEPRYATLPNIMKAKKKPMDKLKASEIGVDLDARLEIVSVEDPPVREAGVKVESVEDLVDKLSSSGTIV